MMKNYMTMGTFARGKKPEGGPTGKVATPLPRKEGSHVNLWWNCPPRVLA
jgi:hypothetical protein